MNAPANEREELLAALRECVDALDRARDHDYTDARQVSERVRAVIAKAEGRA